MEVVPTVEDVGHDLVSAGVEERRDSPGHQEVGDHTQAPHVCLCAGLGTVQDLRTDKLQSSCTLGSKTRLTINDLKHPHTAYTLMIG